MIKISNQNLFLPYYHSIQGNERLPHIEHLYKPKTKKEFEKELDFMLKYYQPISMNELKKHISEEKAFKRPSFHLSFDDGLREVHEIVMPLLLKKGIQATFFLNSSFIDNKELFYRYKVSLIIDSIKNEKNSNSVISQLLKFRYKDISKINQLGKEYGVNFEHFLEKEHPYLNSSQVKDLIQNGFSIGAHSKDHPHYMDLSLQDQIEQTKTSLSFIRKNFNIDYNIFSFPFTDFGVKDDFFNTITSQKLTDLTFSSSGLKKDKLKTHLHRTQMENNGQSGQSIIKTEYLYFLFKSPFGKNIANRNGDQKD